MLDRSRCARAHVLLVIFATSFFILSTVYMPKDRVPLLPHPFSVHRVCSLILLTGLANDPYLVHRKIMKLREKETRHYVGPCFVSTYTPAIVCRIEAVKLVPVESHFRLEGINKFNLLL